MLGFDLAGRGQCETCRVGGSWGTKEKQNFLVENKKNRF